MAFLILTRSGFDDLQASPNCLDSPLWFNKDLLSEQEVMLLRDAGAQVGILGERVDPDSAEDVSKAVASIRKSGGGLVWVEHPPVTPEAVGAEPVPQNLPEQMAEEAASRGVGAMRQSIEAAGKAAAAIAGRTLSRIKKLTTPQGPLLIMPYMGYGTRERLLVLGRVLKDEGFAAPSAAMSKWDNLLDLYKRLESDEVPGARIRASVQGEAYETVSDQAGYFRLEIQPSQPLIDTGWHTVELELLKPRPANEEAVRAVAMVLVPPENARFGIISDIDDTVLWTNVTNKLNMLLILARSNAHTRKPFKGVAAFYRALRDGAGGDEGNPMFYVSNSPWHLYTPLVDFLTVQDIPLGPLLLRELGMKSLLPSGVRHSHKLEKIEHILRTFPDLQFILIGDSGEHDPEIYAEVVKNHPRQIRAIYIRSVNPDPSRIESLDRLIEEVRHTGAQLILAPDSEFSAVHAASEGLISAGGLERVRADKKGDERWIGSISQEQAPGT